MRKFQKPTNKKFRPKQKPDNRRQPARRSPNHNNRPSTPHYNVTEGEKAFLAGTPIDPAPRLRLEDGCDELTMRAMDLITPIGLGQRGLIVAPPGSGKTTILKHICQAVAKARPDIKLFCLLIDERPEEVTDFRRSVQADVRWSTSDETHDHHIATADKLMHEAYDLAGQGQDVFIVIDSLTRLARVHNAERKSSGRTLSGGVDAGAMRIPRKIFGSARNIEDGGSLTIIASILVETGSRMDEVIFEEFKGTGNMEIVLSRAISNQRIFPAIDLTKSRTRKEELLMETEELDKVNKMRRALIELGTVEATKLLVDQLKKYPTNKEMLGRLK
ncbi:MAG: transcription termination factor Rho [Candidatus Omnitrophota bacterium]|jgi:transcription termination factor Rho